MANFSGTENLLAFKGAKLFKGLDEKHPQMLYVCIPVSYNDIELSQDGKRANVGIYMSETSDAYRQACIQRKEQSGDDMTGYTPPSHNTEVRFSREFREKALEAARKRIISEHPEWQTNQDLQNPEINTELKNAMYDAVRIRLGSFYARVRQQSQGQPTSAASAPQGGQQWQPTDEEIIQVDPEDLPF